VIGRNRPHSRVAGIGRLVEICPVATEIETVITLMCSPVAQRPAMG
jgi:hypothetical protein